MSPSAALPIAILNTILGRLAVLFLSGADGDMTLARDAARQMLEAHHPETAAELHLAAKIVTLGMHMLEALSQAATPDMPLTRILRLRGGAVSLSRECHKAERRLDELKNARRAGHPQPQAVGPQVPETQTVLLQAVEPTAPRIDKAVALIEATRPMIQTVANSGAPIWSAAQQQREAGRRITENLKQNQATHAVKVNVIASTSVDVGSAG